MQCIINYRCEPLLHFTYRYNKLPLAPVVLTLTSTQCLTKKRIFFSSFLFLLIFTCALVSLRSLCRHGTNALRQHDSHPQTSPLMFRQDLNQNVRLCFMFSSKRSHARLQLKRAKAAQWTQEALFSFHFCFGFIFFLLLLLFFLTCGSSVPLQEHDVVPDQLRILFLCCCYFEEKHTNEIQCPLNAI